MLIKKHLVAQHDLLINLSALSTYGYYAGECWARAVFNICIGIYYLMCTGCYPICCTYIYAGLLPQNIRLMLGEGGGDASTSTSAASIAAALSSVSKPVAEVTLGRGIPALPKRMVEKMLAWEYVDLAELPPACASKHG